MTETVGLPTLNDILAELAKPGRDPRAEFEAFSFNEGVEKLEDLKPGMKLPGIVTNVTAFGAFVDIGVHQDGLVHVSQLADRFVKDPTEVVKVQQKVSVTVLEVDMPRKRIALSMRSNPQLAQARESRTSPAGPRAAAAPGSARGQSPVGPSGSAHQRTWRPAAAAGAAGRSAAEAARRGVLERIRGRVQQAAHGSSRRPRGAGLGAGSQPRSSWRRPPCRRGSPTPPPVRQSIEVQEGDNLMRASGVAAAAVLAGLLSIGVPGFAWAQAAAPAALPPGMDAYFFGLLYRGPAWTPGETDETKKIQEGHMANIQRMADVGLSSRQGQSKGVTGCGASSSSA